MTLTRRVVIEHLHRTFEQLEWVNAAWLMGSDSFGAADERSDVDLCLDVEDGLVSQAFEELESALRWLAPIAASWQVPEPTWHGHSQRFYRLSGAPETLLVDVAVMERGSTAMRFDEREAHGEPVVLFDRLGIVRSRPLDRKTNHERMQQRLVQLEARAQLFASFPQKEAARGRPLDALWAWQAFVIAPLVEVLRMRHCPERFSFGMRYLDRDLPKGEATLLRDLAFVHDGDDIARKAPAARAWLAAELATLRGARAGR